MLKRGENCSTLLDSCWAYARWRQKIRGILPSIR